MNLLLRSALCLGAGLWAAVPVQAARIQFGDQSTPCTDFDSSGEARPHVADVTPPAGQRLHFTRPARSQNDACPSLDAACALPAYLVAGDRVVVTSSTAEFACVHYVSAKGATTSGLVRADWLHFRSTSEARLAKEGIGTWDRGKHATLVLKPGGVEFGLTSINAIAVEATIELGPPHYHSNTVTGIAYLSDNERDAGLEDEPYDGSHPANAPPLDRTSACRLRLRLLDERFLAIDSNDNCGRLDFAGLYRKR